MMLLKTFDKIEIELTEKQATAIVKEINEGAEVVLVEGSYIRASNISGIHPVDRVFSNEGVLHDGVRVVRKFGVWVDKFLPDVRIDPAHYPEIAKDRVPSPLEFKAHFEQIEHKNARLKAILEGDWYEARREKKAIASGEKPSKVKEIMEQRKKMDR